MARRQNLAFCLFFEKINNMKPSSLSNLSHSHLVDPSLSSLPQTFSISIPLNPFISQSLPLSNPFSPPSRVGTGSCSSGRGRLAPWHCGTALGRGSATCQTEEEGDMTSKGGAASKAGATLRGDGCGGEEKVVGLCVKKYLKV